MLQLTRFDFDGGRVVTLLDDKCPVWGKKTLMEKFKWRFVHLLALH